jgi:hypothetical protein
MEFAQTSDRLVLCGVLDGFMHPFRRDTPAYTRAYDLIALAFAVSIFVAVLLAALWV